MSRGIDFDLDAHFDSSGNLTIDVKLYYLMNNDITEQRLFRTSFTDGAQYSPKLDKIKEFIYNTIVSFNKEEE